MALSTYIELQASVASWLNRTDLGTEIVDFIALAESKMNHGIAINDRESVRLRVDEMKVSTTYLLGTTDDSVERPVFPIPAGMLELEEIRPTGTWTGNDAAEVVTASDECHLERISHHRLKDFVAASSGSGAPGYYADDPTGDNWEIWPQTSNWRVEASYWLDVPDLASNATSEILTRYPDVYLYGALQEGETFLKLQDTQWRDKFIAAINSANSSTKKASWTGATLRTKNPYGWSRVL